MHGKNDFVERSKILLNIDLEIILLDNQNNFAGTLKIMSNAVKNFGILATSLSVLHNYFDSLTKLLFSPYSAKILDLLAKPFFSCLNYCFSVIFWEENHIYKNTLKELSKIKETKEI